MRIRGRRVVWLLASALPLVADEQIGLIEQTTNDPALTGDSSTPDNSIKTSKPQQLLNEPAMEDSSVEPEKSYVASEVTYDEQFRIPPLPVQDPQPQEAEVAPDKDDTDDTPQGNATSAKETGDEIYKTEQGRNKDGGKIDEMEGENVTHVDKESDDNLPPVDNSTENQATLGNGTDFYEPCGGNQSIADKKRGSSDGVEHLEGISADIDEAADPNVNRPQVNDATAEADMKLNETKLNEALQEDVLEEEEEEEDALSRVSVDYASKSAGALIIEKSNSFKGTSNLLNGDKDKYAIAPCNEKKFIVMSLSEDILVKQIKLANYERFSSTVKDFQVMGSQTLGKWFDLGTYSAKSGNGEQIFDLKEPAWARYLKFKFLAHHGVEYYCTYSQIQVHGSTMVQGFHEQWEESGDEDEEDSTDEQNEEAGLTSGEDVAAQSAVETDTPADQTNGTVSSDECEGQEPTGIIEGSKSSNSKLEDGKTIPKAKWQPKASSRLNEKLHGSLTGEKLFSSFSHSIPSILSSLPPASRHSPGRQTTGGELCTLPQIRTLAMQSFYFTSKNAANITRALISNSSESISVPKMSDHLGDSIGQYLMTDLGAMTRKKENSSVEAPTVKVAEKGVQITINHTERVPVNETSNENNATETNSSKTPSKDQSEMSEPHVEQVGSASTNSTNNSGVPDEGSQKQMLNTQANPEYTMDHNIVKLLESLPSAECLSKLDFAQFKAKATASKRNSGGAGQSSAAGSSPMEPIFKKLTDEIKSLQSNLSAHDHFAKASTACYQRVLLDLLVEMQRLRGDHEQRLLKLEDDLRESQAWFVWKACRCFFGACRTLSSWIYTAAIHIFSPLLLWGFSLIKFCTRLPGLIYRGALLRWPAVKSTLLSNGTNSSKLAWYLRPLAEHMDQLVLEMESAAFISPTEEPDEMWRFPVVPIVLLILVGRLVMCFASPPLRATRFPSRSELIAWKAKAMSPRNKGALPTALYTNESDKVGEENETMIRGEIKRDKAKSPQLLDEKPRESLMRGPHHKL